MRILFITNFFPPHHLSGFEMLCHDVVRSLHRRGHRVAVLTSDYRTSAINGEEFEVFRTLKLDSDINYYNPINDLRYWSERSLNVKHVEQAISGFAPDVVFVWGMWNLSKVVAETAERMAGSRVVYYFADAWPTRSDAHRSYWDDTGGNRRGRLFKATAKPVARLWLWPQWRPTVLRFQQTICCSAATRDEIRASGIALPGATVIYEGIELAPFLAVAANRSGFKDESQPRVAYVGRLVAHKGVHTAIEAIQWLAEHADMAVHPRLTVLGEGHPDYEAHLRDLVMKGGLEEQVEFVAPIPREQLPAFLASFDILVLPSIYEEPLALIMQNALAAGLVVIATWTGGTKETIVDGENGLVFLPEDAARLAQQIVRVSGDATLQKKLQAGAVRTAKEMFDLARMVDQIEEYLSQVAEYARSLRKERL